MIKADQVKHYFASQGIEIEACDEHLFDLIARVHYHIYVRPTMRRIKMLYRKRRR